MAIVLLTEPPLTPPAEIGPYRRHDYMALPDEPRCALKGNEYRSQAVADLRLDVAQVWREVDGRLG